MKIARPPFAARFLFGLLTLGAPFAVGRGQVPENLTPLLLTVQDPPVPFMGTDGQIHLVYELGMTNFSSAEIDVEKVEVVGDGSVLQTLDTAAIAGRLQPAGLREPAGTLAKSIHALLFLDVVLDPGNKVSSELSHRVALRASAAPPGHQASGE